MRYIAGEYKRTRGSLILEQATLEAIGEQALLVSVCGEQNDEAHEYVVKAGGWFQNVLVQKMKLCKPNEEGYGKVLAEAYGSFPKVPDNCRGIICAGQDAIIFGEKVYIICQHFGKWRADEANAGDKDMLCKLDGHVGVLLVSSIEAEEGAIDLSRAAAAVMSAKDDNGVKKSLEEIAEKYDPNVAMAVLIPIA